MLNIERVPLDYPNLVLMSKMRRVAELSLIVFMVLMPAVHAERLYVNDKKVPETKEDLLAIQSSLQEHLEGARKATVCLKVGAGSGTGVIVSADGLVLTAAHVVGGVGKELKVLMEDGTEYSAHSLGLNAKNDAAMVQIDSEETFPFVEYLSANSDESSSARVGDWVFALGHSGGFDEERGSVVRLGRLLRVAESTIQSDCKLIGGDSGGPLFDLNGVLIGIHSRVGRRLAQNMHVPLEVFHRDWDELEAGKFVEDGPFAEKPEPGTGFMGVGVEMQEEVLKVTQVEPGYPAEKAGVKVGDAIKKVNDSDVRSKEDLAKLMKSYSDGEAVTLLCGRDGVDVVIRLTLVKR